MDDDENAARRAVSAKDDEPSPPSDRRTGARRAPSAATAVRVAIGARVLQAVLWDVSPRGARVLVTGESFDEVRSDLASTLRSPDPVVIDVAGRPSTASLVWYGASRDRRAILGVELAAGETHNVDPGGEPAPLPLVEIHHRATPEARLARVLSRLARRFQGDSLTLVSILELVCEEARQLTGAEGVTFYVAGQGGSLVAKAGSGGAASPGLSAACEPPIADLATLRRKMEEGEQLFANDLPCSNLAADPRLREIGLRSLMTIPVCDRTTDHGLLLFGHSHNPCAFGPRQQAEAAIVAGQTALLLETYRLHERAEESLRLARQQDRLHILGELSGSVAHELKNTLVPLRMLVELLPEQYGDPEFRDWYHENVPSEVDRMYRLVSHLSDFRRDGAVPVPISPSRCLLEVAEILRAEATSRGVRFALDAPTLPEILVVPNELRQIFMNLVLFAIRASDEGGIVRIAARADQGGILFCVIAGGGDEAREKLARVFDPAAPGGANDAEPGLIIVRDLVAAYGGTIDVEGGGVSLVVRLPGNVALAS